jgi:hypothetical protein
VKRNGFRGCSKPAGAGEAELDREARTSCCSATFAAGRVDRREHGPGSVVSTDPDLPAVAAERHRASFGTSSATPPSTTRRTAPSRSSRGTAARSAVRVRPQLQDRPGGESHLRADTVPTGLRGSQAGGLCRVQTARRAMSGGSGRPQEAGGLEVGFSVRHTERRTWNHDADRCCWL